ncbi:hypothetical protein TNCV_862001 [Trichonephila clavipes]|nr:hypothetical protein TNCV_862001 [Trichonephila clavipes]
MNETTQLNRRKQLNSAAGTKQLNSVGETPQLGSRSESTQLCTAVDLLQPPAPPLQQNRLFLPTPLKGYDLTLDTLREDYGIIRKQASTDGGVLWKVMCVDVVQVRRKNRSLRDPREARFRVGI